MLKITKICVNKVLIFVNFENARKNIMKSTNFFFILYKEKMLIDKAAKKGEIYRKA